MLRVLFGNTLHRCLHIRRHRINHTVLSNRHAFFGSVSSSMLNSLPHHKNTDSLWPQLREAVQYNPRQLVVLDDDPTGCQTVYNVNVLLDHSVDAIREQLESDSKLFYVITNTRAMPEQEAIAFTREVVDNIGVAMYGLTFDKLKPLQIISRGDSTLRGHYPAEVDAIVASNPFPSDGTILVPAFFEGGRITVNDIHYLQEGDVLTPCGETPFAKDAHFGYKSSDLKQWVREKGVDKEVISISIQDIREGGPDRVLHILEDAPHDAVFIVNAAHQHDLNTFILGLFKAEAMGLNFVYRTAASFVASRAALEPIGLLTYDQMLGSANQQVSTRSGGLIVVGSYVPKTSKQLAHLLGSTELGEVLLDATAVIDAHKAQFSGADPNGNQIKRIVNDAVEAINRQLSSGDDVVLYTSREFSPGAQLSDTAFVSATVTDIVSKLATRPRFVISKGGITSFDVARKGLSVRSARVLGQVEPGVPVWQLDSNSKFPGVPYVVFPGNVGSDDSLSRVATKLGVRAKLINDNSRLAGLTNNIPSAKRSKNSFQEADDSKWAGRDGIVRELLHSRLHRQAIAAFNVYNLEGAVAVIRAAEASRTPVILQVHPTSLAFGGQHMLAILRSARKHSTVPVYLHLDHSTKESDILMALEAGVDSVMVDGSGEPFEENISWTAKMVELAHSYGVAVEGELGRLTGEEDGMVVSELQAKMTCPIDAGIFVARTKVDMLAVTIGNVHGIYKSPPSLDIHRLALIRDSVPDSLPLVLHGASGLSHDILKDCMSHGVCKFNVNTDLRAVAMDATRELLLVNSESTKKVDLLDIMKQSTAAMFKLAMAKIHMFKY